MQVSWNYATLENAQPDFSYGVYIIAKSSTYVVYVGQGEIRDRISAHRGNVTITAHGPGLWAYWAEVSPASRDGVERYLADRLNPRVGSHHPNATPIQVNLPPLD